MNLLCPTCQKPLSVPEQYAGQLMKCPLCNNNFMVPPLAPMPAEASVALAPEPETHDATPIDLSGHIPPPFVPPPPPSETEPPGQYGLTPEASPPPPRSPIFEHDAPESPVVSTRPAPPPKPAPPPRPSAPGVYAHTRSLTLDPRVVPWIAPVCLVLVFFFTFFPWVGVYYAGYGVITQSAWGAAFGGYTVDDLYEQNSRWDKEAPPTEKPGAGAVMIFFLLLGLIPAVPLALIAAALPQLHRHLQLPPGIAALEPWRWLMVTGVSLLALFFLFLQVVTSFSIESRFREKVAAPTAKTTPTTATATEAKWGAIQEAMKPPVSGLHRTGYFRFSFVLCILAAIGAITAHWLDHRGAGRPLPRLELMW